MKLLHLADWHLGRTTWNQSRVPDHEEALQEMIDVAREVKPDLILHAGDVWDSVRPAYSDLQRGVAALQELSVSAPVVVLCGNHDSPELFRLLNIVLGEDSRLRFVDRPRLPEDGGILEFPGDAGEIVRLAPVPFIHQNRMVEHLEDPSTWMAAYADRVMGIHKVLAKGLYREYDASRHVLLFAAHLHVTGARYSQSERQLTVTDTYATRVEHVPQVSYAAFGHIHRPQPLPGGVAGRYAGSPIPLDFGEEGEEKEIVIVEAEPGRPARITPHPLPGGRPLRRIAGTLEEIAALAPGVGPSLCVVTVRTKEPASDLTDRVADLLPEAVLLAVQEECDAHRLPVITEESLAGTAEPSFEELFREFVSGRKTSAAAADDVLAAFSGLIRAVEAEEEYSFPGLEDLLAAEPGA
jgi:exonuclease SbcD